MSNIDQVKEILLQQMKALEKKREEMRCTDDLYYAAKINETADRYIKACEVEALSSNCYGAAGYVPSSGWASKAETAE